MIVAQMCFGLVTINGHSKMRHFFTQHNATDVGECGRVCACWLSTSAFALEMHVHFSPAVISSRLSENLAVQTTGLKKAAQDLHFSTAIQI